VQTFVNALKHFGLLPRDKKRERERKKQRVENG
jgi:hypothetical protein